MFFRRQQVKVGTMAYLLAQEEREEREAKVRRTASREIRESQRPRPVLARVMESVRCW
jgi:hypothetical protein